MQIVNSGAAGSLLGALNGVETSTGATYDVPLRDSGSNRNNSGAYPWRIDGDFTTVVSITNAGDSPARFIAMLFYPGGKYVLAPRALAVGETAFFDLKQMRDQRVPDANGDLLPSAVTSGQFRWHHYPAPGTPHLIGRAAVGSVAKGISASYSCFANCSSRGPEYTVYGNPVVLIDGYQTMHTTARWYYSPNGYNEYDTDLSGATVADPTMASLQGLYTGWMNINGLGVGETYYWWTYMFSHDEDDGFDCRNYTDVTTVSEPIVITPRISSLSPARGLIGSSVHVIIQGSGFQFNPTVNAGNGSSVTVNYGNSSFYQIDATFAISANASAGNHPVSVKVNGMTSNSMNFYVQIPSEFVPINLSPSSATCDPGYAGYYADLTYQVADQAGQPINVSGMTPQEHITRNGSEAFPGLEVFSSIGNRRVDAHLCPARDAEQLRGRRAGGGDFKKAGTAPDGEDFAHA